MKSSTMLFAAAAIALGGTAALAQPTTGSGTTPATPASPATPATPADPSTGTAATPATPATPAEAATPAAPVDATAAPTENAKKTKTATDSEDGGTVATPGAAKATKPKDKPKGS